ncbi:MAG: preprotein translocase subunit YajC [Myxococcota bacterium]
MNAVSQLLPFVGMLAVFYFLVIRPQMNERQEHEKLVNSLTRGDKVITASGVHGVIANVAEDTVLLEVSEKTRIVVDKTSIARRVVPPAEGGDSSK